MTPPWEAILGLTSFFINSFTLSNNSLFPFSPTNSKAALLATIVTFAPYLSNSLVRPIVSTQDTEPVIPNQIFLPSR